MEKLLVSVIVPVYGVEKYLDSCVESVINQTYKELEVFLIDDGSPDRCGEMCDEWAKKDSRIKVIHKENGGQGTARNMALDVCLGDYILFVDSDDAIDPDMVEKMIAASNDGEYDLILCSYKVNNGLYVKNAPWYNCAFSMNTEELIKRYLIDKLIFTGPVCKLFARCVFETMRFPNFRANEDTFIMHRLFDLCRSTVVIKEYPYTVRLRDDSTEGRKFNANKLHLLDCSEDLRAFIKEKYPQYTSEVEGRVLDSAIALLDRLYSDGMESYDSEIRDKLITIIKNEFEYLNGIQDQVENMDLLKKADMILTDQKKYIGQIKKQGSKARLKKKMKKILIRLRRIVNK